ncbi:MAG: M13 family metallopeptidase [Myxococcaceae bacterium]
MKRILFAAALALLACKSAPETKAENTPTPKETPKPATPPAAKKLEFTGPMTPGLDEAATDPSVDPCEDFYSYACGGWMKSTEIPPDRSGWSRGFYSVDERNELILKDLLEKLGKGEETKTPYAKQLGDFWASCMDEQKLETADKDLKAELKKLEVKDQKSLATVLGKMHAMDIHPLFNFHSTQDAKDATQVIGELDQGGLGLPDRDYYLSDEPKLKEVRELYAAHVQKMFELTGLYPESAQAAAKNVMELETELAKASLDKVSRRDPNKIYHRINRDGLKKEAPGFPWDVFFKEQGAADVQAMNVTHVPFFQAVDKLAKDTKPNVWKDYLTWRFVEASIPALPKKFQDERFAFVSKALSGAKEDLPRWKKCVAYTDDALGEALAIPYVEKTFGADGKEKTLAMVHELENAFARNLGTLSWMDAETKAKAAEKLQKIANKIGYPDKYKTYDGLKIDRASFLQNLLRSSAYETQRDLKKIGKPVDRTEWEMTPPTVNAYYEPARNEIVFPAGILQPPFFNREATDPVNFGAMGMVVGHEITHGFDDEGSQYDGDGNLKDWWSKTANDEFKQRTGCVKNQYDNYVAIDDLKLNGALTLGENTADNGGLKIAHLAMAEWIKKNAAAQKPSRYSPDQAFFMGFAQSWCTKLRPENARMRVKVDPHSPALWRVNGPLSNSKAFADAFQCKPGQKMVSQNPCVVW